MSYQITTRLDSTISDSQNLLAQLEEHEGVRLKPYRCSADKLTIGVGHNIDDNGITKRMSEFMLIEDVNQIVKGLRDNVPNFDSLDEVRKFALIDMCFNLGLSRFLKFKKMLAAIRIKDWNKAAAEMLDSRWALQVGFRALTLHDMMMKG